MYILKLATHNEAPFKLPLGELIYNNPRKTLNEVNLTQILVT
jgi:hypothetical protein